MIARLAEEGETAAQPEPVPQAPAAPEPVAAPVGVVAPVENATTAADVRATPLARLIARREGIAPGAITGTGPRGLDTRADVTGDRPFQEPAGNDPAADFTVETLSRVQHVIARRMTEAKATIPEFQV